MGVWANFNYKITENVEFEFILAISNKRIWTIRKLKKAGVSDNDVLHVYFMKIRSIFESNCVVFLT